MMMRYVTQDVTVTHAMPYIVQVGLYFKLIQHQLPQISAYDLIALIWIPHKPLKILSQTFFANQMRLLSLFLRRQVGFKAAPSS